MKTLRMKNLIIALVSAALVLGFAVPGVFAQCPAGTVPAFPGSDTCILDPLSIPKYVTPLVIPPVMNDTDPANGAQDPYDIAVRQFKQQILPGGIWNTINGRTDAFPATTLWSYGPASDPAPNSTALGGGPGVAPAPNSQFNYPAYTFETISMTPVDVRWINDLVVDPIACAASLTPETDPNCNALPHLLPIDQTLHWANPPMDCRMGPARTDCAGQNPNPYMGPVPIVTHVHGAHVDPHSDGYPEAWWLPAANDITMGWATEGTLFDDANGQPPGLNLGYADYSYRQDQPATTLWYHDHTLGMTRSNVYAGPAGFWLIRGDFTTPGGTVVPDAVDDGTTPATNDGVLPGPAPVAGQSVLDLNLPTSPVRQAIREIPVVIQDRSFDPVGQLFYQDNRAFFEALNPEGGTAPTLQIPFVPDSDIAPIWNPEAFFTTMVVNGVTWPTLEVAPAIYRIRLLNGCNSRFLNLALFRVNTKGKGPNANKLTKELPFFQIGAEQGFLPQVVEIQTGFATPLPGDGTIPLDRVRGTFKDQALLLALAERADVLVDFRGLKNGDVVRMINTAPDAPFGGFPDIPADPATTGQVMQFVVNSALLQPGDALTTSPYSLVLNPEPALGAATVIREVSLNEGESEEVCVNVALDGSIVAIPGIPHDPNDPTVFLNACLAAGGVPFAPKEALLGTVGTGIDPVTGLPVPVGIPLKWTDQTNEGTDISVNLENGGMVTVNVTENPTVDATEEWDIYNFTVDGHPIHLHLVRFQVVGRALIGTPVVPGLGVQAWETGFKDTVIAYPGEITRVKALFDVAGLYVWHCHIVEHEDNEMMRPYVVSP